MLLPETWADDGEQLLCRETAHPVVALRRISPLFWPPLIPSLPPEGGPCQQRPKNPSSRVALLPGKFLLIRKVFGPMI